MPYKSVDPSLRVFRLKDIKGVGLTFAYQKVRSVSQGCANEQGRANFFQKSVDISFGMCYYNYRRKENLPNPRGCGDHALQSRNANTLTRSLKASDDGRTHLVGVVRL